MMVLESASTKCSRWTVTRDRHRVQGQQRLHVAVPVASLLLEPHCFLELFSTMT